MSHLDNALARLDQLIARRLRDRDPFRAIVTGVTDGMVTIRRLEAATGEDERRARLPGWRIQPGDEVLCLPVNGKPVVIGPVQRSAMVTTGPEVGTAMAATGPVGTVVGKYEVFDASGQSLGWVPIHGSIA